VTHFGAAAKWITYYVTDPMPVMSLSRFCGKALIWKKVGHEFPAFRECSIHSCARRVHLWIWHADFFFNRRIGPMD
jgi:hypothetical protein